MAVKIVIDHLAGSRAGERQEFDLQPKIRFGRHPENEVVFDAHADLDASTRHAELRQEEAQWVLVDVGSSNGTFTGGQKITQQVIPEGSPCEFEFGSGGPRIRIYIGDPVSLVVPMTIVGGKKQPAPPATIAQNAGPARQAGRRSVAMMVQKAMADANEKHGIGKSTMFMKSMVDQAMHASTKRFKFILIGMSAAFVLAVGALVVWNVVLSKKTVAVVRGGGDAGSMIARENHDALWLLAFVDADGAENPFCSSFAVAPKFLATNSHCVDVINSLQAQKLKIFAVRNGDPKKRLDIASVLKHPDYTGSRQQQSTDVALVEVAGTMEKTVKLATHEHLHELTTGATIFVYGFPGRLAKPTAPEATQTNGMIGRITRLNETAGPAEENILIQHSAFTMEGTSGSPVFDSTGVVVAVNAGSYVREKAVSFYDPVTKQFKEKVATAENLTGYNVAIRIDTVMQLLERKGARPGQGTPARTP